jgi:CRP/FNR family transcriptional regulator, anaerobic regulatory protein
VITYRATSRTPPQALNQVLKPVLASTPDDNRFASLGSRATLIRAKRGQQLALGTGATEAVYIVRSGLLVVQAAPPAKLRQLLALLYPGDIFRSTFAPPLPGTVLTAAGACDLWRLQAPIFETALSADAELGRRLGQQLADQQARKLMHVAIIGGMSGEERVASFLIELALRIGTNCAAGISFEIPLSRADIADYLALNPDTLSRIMSRLRARGVVSQPGRRLALVQNWNGLCALSPMAEALIALHGKTPGQPAIAS